MGGGSGGGGNPMHRVHRIWMMAIGWVAVKIFFMSGVLVLRVPGLLNIIIIIIIIVFINLFGGPLWPYTYAPALAEKLVSEH